MTEANPLKFLSEKNAEVVASGIAGIGQFLRTGDNDNLKTALDLIENAVRNQNDIEDTVEIVKAVFIVAGYMSNDLFDATHPDLSDTEN